MEILPPTQEALASAIECIRAGGVVAHATETCYGLACDLSNPDAVTKLFTIKRRPAEMPVSGLFPSWEHACQFVVSCAQADELAAHYLPGPLTIVAPLKTEYVGTFFNTYLGNEPTIGVRVSPHPIAQALVQTFGSPLSTTSGNLHSKPNPYTAEDIVSQFEGHDLQPDMIIDSGRIEEVPPSSIVRIVRGDIEVLRKGPLLF